MCSQRWDGIAQRSGVLGWLYDCAQSEMGKQTLSNLRKPASAVVACLLYMEIILVMSIALKIAQVPLRTTIKRICGPSRSLHMFVSCTTLNMNRTFHLTHLRN